MKNSNSSFLKTFPYYSFILGAILLFAACDYDPTAKYKPDPNAVVVEEENNDILWNVIAILPDGKTMDVKAIDKDGSLHDIKAIQNSDQDSFLDVKAIVDGKKLPVKMLVSNDPYADIKAIAKGGTSYNIKAISPEGERLDVNGVSRIGSVVIIRCVSKDGKLYGVKAISPEGQLNDIKGIKINTREREMSFQGLDVYAHVKAMHPVENEENYKVPPKPMRKREYKSNFERVKWNIKAVTPEGKNLDVKAFDLEGNKFDVKATQDSKQHSFMNIIAFVEGYEVPVRILTSENEYSPVKAVGSDGTIYDIKALNEEGEKLNIKGVGRSGNIVHVKAINENGEFYGVKAFSPDGKLNDVKGIKIFDKEVELSSQGNDVYAHLKAISQ